jgi:hypothetical protein
LDRLNDIIADSLCQRLLEIDCHQVQVILGVNQFARRRSHPIPELSSLSSVSV